MGMWVDIPWVGVKIPWVCVFIPRVGGSKYHGEAVDIPSVGVRYTIGRGSKYQYTMSMGIKIQWVGGRFTMVMGVKIPWRDYLPLMCYFCVYKVSCKNVDLVYLSDFV
jgi:hypothetical protein